MRIYRLTCPEPECRLYEKPLDVPEFREAILYRDAHNWAFDHTAAVQILEGKAA